MHRFVKYQNCVFAEITPFDVNSIGPAQAIVEYINMAHFIPVQEKAKSIAWRVRSSREDLEWNQENLADKSGVSRSYISNIESGRIANITIDIAFALADALGVSRAYLIGLTEDPLAGVPDSKADAEERLQLDAVTQEFIHLYQQLGDDKKQTLLNLARMLRSADEPKIIGGAA